MSPVWVLDYLKIHYARRMIECFTDPKTWILFIMAIGAQIPNSALTSFTSLIIKSFGFGTLGTQYLQIPGGAVQFLSLLGGGIICSKFPNIRCAAMIVANSICIIGAALLVGLPDSNKWGRLVAIWLCYFQGLGFSMSLTMVSSNVAGYTKKQLTSAILFTGYCVSAVVRLLSYMLTSKVGNIIGPQTFRDSEAPYYHSAYVAMLVGYTVKLLAIVVLYAYMWSVNKKRDREAATAGALSEDEYCFADRASVRNLTAVASWNETIMSAKTANAASIVARLMRGCRNRAILVTVLIGAGRCRSRDRLVVQGRVCVIRDR